MKSSPSNTSEICLLSSPTWRNQLAIVKTLHELWSLDWSKSQVCYAVSQRDSYAAAQWWRQKGGSILGLSNPPAVISKLPDAKLALVFVAQQDPDCMAALDIAATHAVPVLYLHEGDYPRPTGWFDPPLVSDATQQYAGKTQVRTPPEPQTRKKSSSATSSGTPFLEPFGRGRANRKYRPSGTRQRRPEVPPAR